MSTTAILSLNGLSVTDLRDALLRCCGSSQWVKEMLARAPFLSLDDLLKKADWAWNNLCDREASLEAFRAHPRIGSKRDVAQKTDATWRAWSSQEQAGASNATATIQERLALVNEAYESRFGYIYIVCATGKSAEELLHLAEQRLNNDADSEWLIAREQQHLITRLRLCKWIESLEK